MTTPIGRGFLFVNKAISNIERCELNSKLKQAVNEITLLGIKMKQFKSDAEIDKHTNYQTIGASNRNNPMPHCENTAAPH
jgi:hypothetical protein